VRQLQVWGAPKLESVQPLVGIELDLLILEDMKRLCDLSPIAEMNGIETLMYSG